MESRLFISDLHLSAERPDIIERFQSFLLGPAAETEHLYILGDFVEYWVGDDDPADGLSPAFDSLRRLSDTGVCISFMAGNRDFLIGNGLAERCGFELITEPLIIEHEGQRILLLHGDSLCIDDTDYQQFRSMVRDPVWQQGFLAKPLEERIAIAEQMRATSKDATAGKDAVIMDVNQDAVIEAMGSANANILIHGHTHRPAVHSFTNDGTPIRRIVLPDWYETGGYLSLSDLDDIRLSMLD